MKTPVLCYLLFVASLAITQAQQSQPQMERSPRNDQASVQESITSVQNPSLSDDRSYLLLESGRASGETGEGFCAFLRTYRVKRPYSGSDVVTPAGYSTCLPSRRFELKSAVDTQTQSEQAVAK
jgi:hypothetical protein